MEKRPHYAAWEYPEGWKVVILRTAEHTPLGDFRTFNTFDEANQVARKAADGKYGYKPGAWVNMR